MSPWEEVQPFRLRPRWSCILFGFGVGADGIRSVFRVLVGSVVGVRGCVEVEEGTCRSQCVLVRMMIQACEAALVESHMSVGDVF